MGLATRVPDEFLYWENRDRPVVKAIRAAWKAALGYDPAPPDEVVRTLASMYYDADPLAEAFVDEVWLPCGFHGDEVNAKEPR